jgi:hypothetical protein
MRINKDIEEAIQNDNLVFFVGSGFSKPLGLPAWPDLIDCISEDLKKAGETDDFICNIVHHIQAGECTEIEALDILKQKGYREKIIDIVQKQIDVDLSCHDLRRHKKLWEITSQIITTNYDKAFEMTKPKVVKKIVYNDQFKVANISEKDRFLFKVHGCISDPGKCVLFSDQYMQLYNEHAGIAMELFRLFAHKCIIFVGFSLNDPFVTELLQLRKTVIKKERHGNYIITIEEKDFASLDVEKINAVKNYEEDLDMYLDRLAEIRHTLGNFHPL